jgi:hypothetical protein
VSREVKRVPMDFDAELDKVWPGYLSPDRFAEDPCTDCGGTGWSPRARYLKNLWYGYVPFDPTETGSTPLLHDTPAVRARAERNIQQAPDYYGTGEPAIRTEAQRLADLWNAQWGHHLAQEDVDALIEADRLYDLTKTWTRENGWQPKEPPVHPTAAEVNEWSLSGFGHDGINQYTAVRARCEREGVSDTCGACTGHGSFEAYEGQRAEAEAWERTEPPEGDGWQLWQTVSEGSPISPVFGTAEELARWMASPAYTWGVAKNSRLSYEAALAFVQAGWAPTLISTPETGLVTGVEYVGQHTAGADR